jgi:4-hydroxythreonine-4-phosphate dehydrogenase
MTDSYRPLLAITLGDPAGIGPEVILKALQHTDVYERARPFGHRRPPDTRTRRRLGQCHRPHLRGRHRPDRGVLHSRCRHPARPRYRPGRWILGRQGNGGGRRDGRPVRLHRLRPRHGPQGRRCRHRPPEQASMHLAGHTYPGHTELLAIRTNADKVSMLLVGPTCASSMFPPTWHWRKPFAGSPRNALAR